MVDNQSRIARNLDEVRLRIAAAAKRCGRPPEDVTLVAVTKYVGQAEVAALLAAGCKNLGESRPQELWTKAANVPAQDVCWHLVGHLQRNKIARTLPLVTLVQSVDSVKLLRALEAACHSNTIDVLLEVNVSGDSAKHGFAPGEIGPLEEILDDLLHVQVRGLMAMAAREGGVDRARQDFAQMRELCDRLRGRWRDARRLDILSMGMSGDYEVAIREGATMVRVGSALFEGIERVAP